MYEFTTPDDPINKIRIDVRCGSQRTVIYLRILLDPSNVKVHAVLESNMVQAPNYFSPAENIKMIHFENPSAPVGPAGPGGVGSNPVLYRIRFTLSVFGEVVYDTVNKQKYTYTDDEGIIRNSYTQYTYLDETTGLPTPIFEAEEINEFSSFIDLMEQDFDHFIFILPQSIQSDDQVRFRIWANFYGQKFFTETDFLINIIGWRPQP